MVGDPSIPLKYTVDIQTGMPKKTLGTTQLLNTKTKGLVFFNNTCYKSNDILMKCAAIKL